MCALSKRRANIVRSAEMLVPVQWQDEDELFEAVDSALESSDEFEAFARDERG